MKETIKFTIPASSANLGSGFDTLCIAVNLLNYFEIELSDSKTTLEVIEGLDNKLQPPCQEMVKAAAHYFFKRSGAKPKDFTLRINNKTPIARGLASSATIRLAVLVGLNQLLNLDITERDIVKWAAELEGCTDNVSACYYGGLTASGIIKNKLAIYRFDIPDKIDFVAVSPSSEVETDKARDIFSRNIPREDAIYTLNRGILLASAFAIGDYESMGDLFDDRIHQPQRQANIPALKPLFDVIKAARKAGAIGAYLSGSGSTMMALTIQNKEDVAIAMKEAIAKYNMQAEIRFLKADNSGLQYVFD